MNNAIKVSDIDNTPEHIAAFLAAAKKVSSPMDSAAPVGVTGYLDRFDLDDLPAQVAHGVDPHGREYVAMKVRTTWLLDWEHTTDGVFVVFQRYNDQRRVWATAGAYAMPLCYEDAPTLCAELIELVQTGSTLWNKGELKLELI